ncbi:hypothetical protein [Phytohabitans houttuyneae]|uniref:Uncharacterized protein n=1 Tax=Phytohabitans houttuyneae TaxID=1076126 RepID=A0A6V8KIR4_9ACTN|nr:hypothetical protein [Phytohabitans houttuyneae]GFJ81597.1 hypothetical protein Phou_057770 [Phytohabitans houttuyneae]
MTDYPSPLARACLAGGPALLAASTFFWSDGRYGPAGGTLLVLAMPLWTYGIVALLDRMRADLPRYAAVVLLLTLVGAMGGAAFGFQGFFESVYGLDEQTSLAALDAHPVTAGILLWGLGPMFPAALFALGAGLVRTRRLPRPVALLLCAGALLFPVSRIPRVEWVAHLVDLVLLVPFLVAAGEGWTRPRLSRQPSPTS